MVMVLEVELINLQNAPLQYFQLSAMSVAEKLALKKKLKVGLGHVKSAMETVGIECERELVEKCPLGVEGHMILANACSNDHRPALKERKRKLHLVSKEQKKADDFSGNEVILVAEKSEAASTVTIGDTLARLDAQDGKALKMDLSKIRQCATVLKKLMDHPVGWVFNQPVDPVALNIPDYFSVISKPMDLGTIKQKLERKLYSSTDQFAADVRLTFSNAMTYNPPLNDVHIMAKNLNGVFSSRWKSLELKWRKECSSVGQQSTTKMTKKQPFSSKQLVQRASFTSNSLSRKFLTSAEKLRLRRDLEKITRRHMPPKLLKFLQKTCLLRPGGNRIDVDIDILDEKILWELHQIVRSCVDAGAIKSAGAITKREQGLVQDSCKGSGSTEQRYGCDNNALKSPFAYKHGTCGHTDFTQASSSDVDSERTSGREFTSDMDSKRARTDVQMGYRSSDSDGRKGPVGDGDSADPTSPTSPVASSRKGEDDPPCEELSPTRALRAAMLKSRFADMIVKAQQKTLLNHGEKGDPARMQREREKLRKKQQEEKARIEAQVKAAEAAARMKAEAELKMQIERKREAARLALQKMEKTVDFDENSQILKDLENLGYSQPLQLDAPHEMVVNFMDGVELQSGYAHPLQQLGLFIKEDDDDVDEEADDWMSTTANGDVEEGEIASS